MPWVLKRPGKDGFLRRDGHYDASKRNAMRFDDKKYAQTYAPHLEVVADYVRKGIDRPCAIHKGPAGNCQPWNCTCF
jgi:hypothetical protein